MHFGIPAAIKVTVVESLLCVYSEFRCCSCNYLLEDSGCLCVGMAKGYCFRCVYSGGFLCLKLCNEVSGMEHLLFVMKFSLRRKVW
jgi:hypothetical protein